jgi:pimeloyl-ACP methyl ester carboxylesterase
MFHISRDVKPMNKSESVVEREAGSYASVNGLNIYYEIHGIGKPLVLLHGGAGATGMYDEVLMPSLSKNRQVITVDLQAHGRTADIERPLSYELMADDMLP